MPVPTPVPNTPPAVTVPSPQYQSQSQNQQGGDNTINSSDTSKSESQASSLNSISQSPISSNTQINYSSSGEWQFLGGVRRQEVSIGLYTNYNSRVGGVDTGFTLNIPIGGKSSKLSSKLIEEQNRTIALENATKELSMCNSLFSQNLVINYSMLPADHPAQRCDGLIIAKTVEVQKPLQVLQEQRPARDAEIAELRLEHQRFRVQLQKFQKRLNEQREQNPFTPRNDGE